MQQVKNVAKKMAVALNGIGCTIDGKKITKGHTLDLIAKALDGVEGWNALSAKMLSAPSESAIKQLIKAAESVQMSYDDTGCDSCGVIDVSVSEQIDEALEAIESSNKFVIVSDQEKGFWSDEDGWGDYCNETCIYSAAEISKNRLPSIGVSDARYLPLAEAPNYFSCTHCGCELVDGFCSDDTCLYSDYPQSAIYLYDDHDKLDEKVFSQKYASVRRVCDLADHDEAVSIPQKSLHELRSEAAEKAFQEWEFPFEVGGTSGWDSTTSNLGSDWDRQVFLEIPNENNTTKAVFSLSFSGNDATPLSVWCTDQNGEDCGHGPMRDFTVTLDAGTDDEVDAFSVDIEAQNQDEARVLAKVLYPSFAVISMK